MAVNVQSSKMTKKDLIMWVITIGIPLAILLVPTTEVFSTQIRLFLAITVMAILMFAFENVNQTVVALMLPIAYIAFKFAPSSAVLSPWTGNVPWMVLGGMLLADVLTSNGLLKRIAYKCIIVTGGTYRGILIGLFIAGILLNLFIPGKVAIPLAALSYGICTALNLGRSKEAAGIMLVAATSAVAPPFLFLFNPTFFIMVNAGLEATGPLDLTWANYFTNNFVSIIFIFATVVMAMFVFKPEKSINGKNYFVGEYGKLGNMTISEKKSIVIIFVLLIALMTSKIHGLEAGWCFAFIPLILFLPGINVGTADILRKANYGFIIFVASCMTIGSTAGAIGLGKIIANSVMPMLEGQSITFVLMFVWALCVILNFLLTPLAVMSAFSLPLAEISIALNINPLAMYFTMSHGLDQILMPYEYALYMVYFSFGLIHLKDFMKFMGLKMLINGVFVFVILIPFWKWIGFLNM